MAPPELCSLWMSLSEVDGFILLNVIICNMLNVADNKHLKLITGCQLLFNIRTHRYLQRVQHLIPENILVSQNDVIPGVAEASKDPKGDCTNAAVCL
jgi:hypothetical protein